MLYIGYYNIFIINFYFKNRLNTCLVFSELVGEGTTVPLRTERQTCSPEGLCLCRDERCNRAPKSQERKSRGTSWGPYVGCKHGCFQKTAIKISFVTHLTDSQLPLSAVALKLQHVILIGVGKKGKSYQGHDVTVYVLLLIRMGTLCWQAQEGCWGYAGMWVTKMC